MWREVEGPAGMPGQPLAHLRVLVSCVFVNDGVDLLSRRHLRLDGVEEADELLVPVTLHIAADTVPSRTLRAANSVVVP